MAVTWPAECTKRTGKPLEYCSSQASSIKVDISYHMFLRVLSKLVDPPCCTDCRQLLQVAYPCPYTLNRQVSTTLLHFAISSKIPSFIIQNNATFKFLVNSQTRILTECTFLNVHSLNKNPHLFYSVSVVNKYISLYAFLYIQIYRIITHKCTILSIERKKMILFYFAIVNLSFLVIPINVN